MRMGHRTIGWLGALVVGALFLARAAVGEPAKTSRPPNIVLIFADDLGYGDLGCYGAKGYETPNLDHLARQGVRFTDFYVPQAVCSASRAALLTGCYSNRVGILGALGPGAKIGINADEVTMAEALKARGYATAIYGKWHLGDHPAFLPTRHGFDDYFGLPYSNDMWPKHPTTRTYPDLPLMEGEKVTQLNPDQTQLTTWYTEHAVRFIEKNKERPFFLYVPHSMPHVPLFVSEKYVGKSKRGLFGDVIQEIDGSVGEIVSALRRNRLAENTLVVFTSDNGPWLSYGDHAGTAGPLREGKGTEFEGGVREPAIAWWPGRIPAGSVCREPAMTIDLLPTFVKLAGGELPKDRTIDGRDIWPLLSGQKDARSPHEALYFYWGGHLDAVRSGKWKLHLPHEYRSLKGEPGSGGTPGPYETRRIELSLFDLQTDLGETRNVAAEHAEVVQRLLRLAEAARADLGDTETAQKGAGVRPPGRRPEGE
jgi:arylsulfatase A